MAGVSLVVVAVLVVAMRAGGGAAADPPEVGAEDEVPTSLAGGIDFGEVPPAVADGLDEPVVAIRVLDEPPDGIEPGCGQGMVDVDHPDAEVTVVVTPDAVEVSVVGPAAAGGFEDGPLPGRPMPAEPVPAEPMPMEPPPPPPPGAAPPDAIATESSMRVQAADEPGAPAVGGRAELDIEVEADAVPEALRPAPPPFPEAEDQRWQERCTWREADGGWISEGGMAGTVSDHGMDMGSGMSCCDEGGMATATSSVRVPDGAAWALQDRGAYWLAYPTADLEIVPLSWRFRQGPFGNTRGTTLLRWIDDAGQVIDEQYISA